MTRTQRHPIPYQDRKLLLSKRERALYALDGIKQLSASFHEQVDRLERLVNAGLKQDPAEVHRMHTQFKHEAGVVLQALNALHAAMKAAYPKGKILWAQDIAAPWDPPGTAETYCHPDFEDEARRTGLLPADDQQTEENGKRPAEAGR